jgi:hypothetical protein
MPGKESADRPAPSGKSEPLPSHPWVPRGGAIDRAAGIAAAVGGGAGALGDALTPGLHRAPWPSTRWDAGPDPQSVRTLGPKRAR